MPLFNWKEEYSVNIEELDQHHKRLIDIMNRLYDHCMQVDTIGCVGPELAELTSYTDYHFKAEELYMQQIQYFDISEHMEKHAMFTFKINELQQIQHENEQDLTKALIIFLGKWLLHHVLEEDRKYALHALEQQTIKQ